MKSECAVSSQPNKHLSECGLSSDYWLRSSLHRTCHHTKFLHRTITWKWLCVLCRSDDDWFASWLRVQVFQVQHKATCVACLACVVLQCELWTSCALTSCTVRPRWIVVSQRTEMSGWSVPGQLCVCRYEIVLATM